MTETRRVAVAERQTTAALVGLLAELDARELYFAEGYASLFAFCTQALHLSEQAAYARIEAARTVRQFPLVLTLLEEGAVTLTTVGLLRPHLTEDNHEGVLGAARHKSKRAVEQLIVAMHPQPDIPSSVRVLPVVRPASRATMLEGPQPAVATRAAAPRPARAPVVAPLAPTRYLVRITVSEDTYRKLERAKQLLRHQIPDGDPAVIFDRALTALVAQAEKTKFAAMSQPARTLPTRQPPAEGLVSHGQRSIPSRRIPSAVRRAVWARDGGRCAFVGTDGRCTETGFLEFHHVISFAAGGPSTITNLQLRCRSHNLHEAAVEWGPWRGRQAATTRSGPS